MSTWDERVAALRRQHPGHEWVRANECVYCATCGMDLLYFVPPEKPPSPRRLSDG